MLSLVVAFLTLALVVASFAFIVGAYKTGKNLVIGILATSFLLFAGVSWYESCPHTAWILIVLCFLCLLFFFRRWFVVFKPLWWLAAGYIKFNYIIGVWLAERILLRFPVVLLPAGIRHVVMVSCFLLPQTLLVIFADGYLRLTNHCPILLCTSSYRWILLPLAVLLVLGHLGKWLYRRREAKGLANV